MMPPMGIAVVRPRVVAIPSVLPLIVNVHDAVLVVYSRSGEMVLAAPLTSVATLGVTVVALCCCLRLNREMKKLEQEPR